MEHDAKTIISKIKNQFSEGILESYPKNNQSVFVVKPTFIKEMLITLKKVHDFDILLDVIAIDWQDQKPTRFELDYPLYSTKTKTRVLLKVFLENNEKPEIESVTAVYGSADWAERECFDMMGIHFTGHPNLKRLLMWDNFIGHPLRKDYPLNRRQPIPIQEDIV